MTTPGRRIKTVILRDLTYNLRLNIMIPEVVEKLNQVRKNLSLFDKYSERHSGILGAFAGTLSVLQPQITLPVTAGIFAVAMGLKTGKVRKMGISKTKGLKEVIKDPWYFAGLWIIAFYLAKLVI